MIQVKTCTRCGEPKHITEFSRHRRSPDGRAWQCKECNSKRAKIWRSTPEGIYQNIKGRTNHYKRTTFELDKEEFIQWYITEKRVCHYCSIPEDALYLLRPRFRVKSSRLTVDRKDNDQGYFLENLVLACCQCNSIKCDELTHDEMFEFGQKYLRPKWENRRTNK